MVQMAGPGAGDGPVARSPRGADAPAPPRVQAGARRMIQGRRGCRDRHQMNRHQMNRQQIDRQQIDRGRIDRAGVGSI